jgi:hypothetical protein
MQIGDVVQIAKPSRGLFRGIVTRIPGAHTLELWAPAAAKIRLECDEAGIWRDIDGVQLQVEVIGREAQPENWGDALKVTS